MADCPDGKKKVCSCRGARKTNPMSRRQQRMASSSARKIMMEQFKAAKAAGTLKKRTSFKKYMAQRTAVPAMIPQNRKVRL